MTLWVAVACGGGTSHEPANRTGANSTNASSGGALSTEGSATTMPTNSTGGGDGGAADSTTTTSTGSTGSGGVAATTTSTLSVTTTSNASGSSGGTTTTGTTVGSDTGGIGGGGTRLVPCSELQAPEVAAACSEMLTRLEPAGGELLEGTYQLVSWESQDCFALVERIRYVRLRANVFRTEVVFSLTGRDPQHNSGTTTVDGTRLVFDIECPAEDAHTTVSLFSVLETEEGTILRAAQEDGTAVADFLRVGD